MIRQQLFGSAVSMWQPIAAMGARHTTVRAFLAWALLAGASCAWSAAPQIVARVNGEAVTHAEMKRLVDAPVPRAELERELDAAKPERSTLERVALNKLIQRRIILQEASRRKLAVSEQELDQAIGALRRRFNDLQSLGKWMKERGVDDKSLFGVMRGDILTNRVREALVEKVRISDKEVQQFYQAQKRELGSAGSVRLKIIAVKDPRVADEIMAALKIGADFGRLARERSIGIRAAKGGDTGWISPSKLPPALREVVGTLKAGETGGPLMKGAELLIVRLVERRAARFKDLAIVRPQIQQHLLVAKQGDVYRGWLSEREKKSKIELFLP